MGQSHEDRFLRISNRYIPAKMVHSTFYVLVFVVSIVKSAPNPFLENVPGVGEWISSSTSSSPAKEVPNKQHVEGNSDEPMAVDDLLDQLRYEIKISNHDHKSEMTEILQQLETALHDNSINKTNVLMKGNDRVVDLGLAGSVQRKKSAEKATGLVAFLSGIGKWFCSFFTGNMEEEEVEASTLSHDNQVKKNQEDGNEEGESEGVDVKYINSVQSLWKADDGENEMKNFGFGVNLNKLKNWLKNKLLSSKSIIKRFNSWRSGSDPVPSNGRIPQDSPITKDTPIPKKFDLREAVPACKELISLIRDQSVCASCWAMVPASVFSDRYCIGTKGKFKQSFSAEDLLRCCHSCKDPNSEGNGCAGGDIHAAIHFMMNEGIVTGGEYGSAQGCIPYSFAPPSWLIENTAVSITDHIRNAKSEQCDNKCSNPQYETEYFEDKYYMHDAYILPITETDAIKRDLMAYGSCIATMVMYEDFKYYKSGIYHHVMGKFLIHHLVRLIGWGTEKGVNYWLAANTGGKSWGEKGVLKINADNNGVNFGKYIICPIPLMRIEHVEGD